MAIHGSYLAALIARFKIIFCMASWLIDTLEIRLAIASAAVSSSLLATDFKSGPSPESPYR